MVCAGLCDPGNFSPSYECSHRDPPWASLASTSDAKDAAGYDVDRHPMWKTCP